MRISFDLDGTCVDFYSFPDWLKYLINEDATPYRKAKPLVNLSRLAYYLNRLQERGYEICIISWTSKNSSPEFHEEVIKAKREWLKRHMPSVVWDEINIIPYGEPKQKYYRSPLDILFDDTLEVREAWSGKGYDEKEIFTILKSLLDFNR